ncbi:MAG: hypothetical protein M0D57_19275 [Sphingobacteriales bacterium JAD_PAG50586_3]|nr:MAG: hypothetical protein M0D57_19275 [Sphingobacteriales bacterium JAD_PAG50586_3]
MAILSFNVSAQIKANFINADGLSYTEINLKKDGTCKYIYNFPIENKNYLGTYEMSDTLLTLIFPAETIGFKIVKNTKKYICLIGIYDKDCVMFGKVKNPRRYSKPC